jgi:hypothetical protein
MATTSNTAPTYRYVVAPGHWVLSASGARKEGAELGAFDLTSAELQLCVQQGRVIRVERSEQPPEGV